MFKFVNKIPLNQNGPTLLDFVKKYTEAATVTKVASTVEQPVEEVKVETPVETKEAETEVQVKEAGELPQGLKDYLDGKKDKKDDDKDDKKDEPKDEKKDEKDDDKKSCCAETEKVEVKQSSAVKWVKVSKLTKEQKDKFTACWGKVMPKEYLDAWLAD